MIFSNKHYLITGGAGFIGSHLADYLVEHGAHVRVLDNFSTGSYSNLSCEAHILEGDVTNPADVEIAMAGMDGCFHLAAISSVEDSLQNPQRSHQVNYGGMSCVFDCAAKYHIPVVYASSAAVYGAAADLPVNEKTHPVPLSLYGQHKLKGELYARLKADNQELSSVGVRIFNCYGPRQHSASEGSGVIARFCEKLYARQIVTIYGDGQQTRDFIYVADVVRLLALAMEYIQQEDKAAEPKAMIVNAATGRAVNLLDLLEILGALLKFQAQVDFKPARLESILHSQGSCDYARSVFEWSATTPLDIGLSLLLNNHK